MDRRRTSKWMNPSTRTVLIFAGAVLACASFLIARTYHERPQSTISTSYDVKTDVAGMPQKLVLVTQRSRRSRALKMRSNRAAPKKTSNPPTNFPSVSAKPSQGPSSSPSTRPSSLPSVLPTYIPSKIPSVVPSQSIAPSDEPSWVPSDEPTQPPSLFPSSQPSNSPTSSHMPTSFPSDSPSQVPSLQPSPSEFPSRSGLPSNVPSLSPTSVPSDLPTSSPSLAPSVPPTRNPTDSPTKSPSQSPSSSPTKMPSARPSFSPTENPSSSPTRLPSPSPSSSPTAYPSTSPSTNPTTSPSHSPSSVPSQSPTEFFAETVFYAIADLPYNAKQRSAMPGMIASIPDDAAFVVHLGDIKSSSDPCDISAYQQVEGFLAPSAVPSFVVVGDNEWNDCDNATEALGFWRNTFVRFDRKYWDHDLDVKTMPGRPESFTFINRGTLFIGLNLVGSPVLDWKEWNNRTSEQLEWTLSLIEERRTGDMAIGAIVIMAHANLDGKHKRFVDPLVDYIQNVLENNIPVMYIGGDNHSWLYDPGYKGQSSFLRVRKTGGTNEPPMRIVVNPHDNRFRDFGVKASTTSAFQLSRFPGSIVTARGEGPGEASEDL